MIRYNFFSGNLPDRVIISGKEYEINTDFRVGFELEDIMRSSDAGEIKILRMLKAYYPIIPADIQEAVEQALYYWTQCRGVDFNTGRSRDL